MHMDEEDATQIAKRIVEAFVCETKQKNINMDGADDGETH